MRRIALVLGSLLFASPAAVDAQGVARTFEQLSVLVLPGETVWVTDASGTETEGVLATVGADGLDLQVGGQPRRWAIADVRRVRHREDDPVRNGVLWGTAIGGAAAATLWIGACAIDDCGGEDVGWAIAGTGVYAAAGAGIGALIDSARKGSRVVFESGSAGAHLGLAPIAGAGRRGVAVRLRF